MVHGLYVYEKIVEKTFIRESSSSATQYCPPVIHNSYASGPSNQLVASGQKTFCANAISWNVPVALAGGRFFVSCTS